MKEYIYKRDNKSGKQTMPEYSYYSKVLKEPFETVEELREAEEAHYAKIEAEKAEAAQKKSDTEKVEAAFAALNAARKDHKESMAVLAHEYSVRLAEVKHDFETACANNKAALTAAEKAYQDALKEFTDKHPEGYQLELTDGDTKTVIRRKHSDFGHKDESASDLFDWLFRD